MIRNRVSPAHRRLVFKALALVSLGLFVYLVLRMDVSRIWARILGLGSKGLMILLALRLAYWVLRAWGWALVLRAAGEALLPGRLLAARLAGHAVAYLTPAAKLGGEAVRVLHVRGVDRKTLLASAVVDKTVEFLATLTCIAVAFIWILAQGSVPGIRFVTLPALSAVFAAALIWFYRKQKRGLFEWLLRGLTKIRLLGAPLEKKRESVRLIDARIAALYREQSRTLRLVFLIYLGLILVWALEIRLTFALM